MKNAGPKETERKRDFGAWDAGFHGVMATPSRDRERLWLPVILPTLESRRRKRGCEKEETHTAAMKKRRSTAAPFKRRIGHSIELLSYTCFSLALLARAYCLPSYRDSSVCRAYWKNDKRKPGIERRFGARHRLLAHLARRIRLLAELLYYPFVRFHCAGYGYQKYISDETWLQSLMSVLFVLFVVLTCSKYLSNRGLYAEKRI